MDAGETENAALAAIDAGAIARDLAAVVQVPSVTGEERPVLERLGELAAAHDLSPQLVDYDLTALRAHPDHPGEEAPRGSLSGLDVTLDGSDAGAGRLCLNGHVDVVGPGDSAWPREPFSGEIAGGWVYGRGSVDMKGGVIAALHAMSAVRRVGGSAPATVVLQAVASEEDGGLGTFAALERDAAFDAALIPEPSGFEIACAQAGALTFTGTVPGVPAHAAVRLEGVSAIDRYMDVHAALHAYEREVNTGVEHPLMRDLPLPYPLSVGRINGGRWSSQVPDRVEFEGRVGVRVEESVAGARAAFEATVREACPEASIAWTGGQFAPGSTPAEHPFCRLVQAAGAEELGAPPRFAGVPYGSDMRHFSARGIPAVMYGTRGIELAHAVDERVSVDELAQVARTIVRVLLRFRRA